MVLKRGLESEPSETPVQLGLLGGFRLKIQQEEILLPKNAQRLITFLALRDQPVQRKFVSGTLWGESTETRAAGSLRSALWRLHDPSYDLISISGESIRLSPTVAVDLREGEAIARTVLDPSSNLDDDTDAQEEVLSLDLLPDWTEDWILMERERWRQLRLRALEALSRRLTSEGRFGQAVQAGLAAVAGEPLRESARRALIAAHLAEKNVAAALREYNSFRQLLADELGIEPSATLRSLLEGLT